MAFPGYMDGSVRSRPGGKPPKITIHGRHFVDEEGRVVHLRGCNVGSISKVPSSDPLIDMADPTQTSYVNRPFPLDEAPEHWRRLKRWGFGFLRIGVTWEAVEHAGPGIYDEEYLAYLRALLRSMSEHGLLAYVCLHQDVWSRHCGGSGAPAWTLEYAGFDLSDQLAKLDATGAAYVEGVKSRGKALTGDRGLWPTGYQKLACATMNTLFWAGKTFAPRHVVQDPTSDLKESKNIQDFLQERYLATYHKVVSAVGDIEGVLGFELMNEPHPGYIGMDSLHEFNYNTDLHLGSFPSPLQSFALGAGHAMHIPQYIRSWPQPTRVGGSQLINPRGVAVWSDRAGLSSGEPCIWAREGVWAWNRDAKKPVVLKEGYFGKHPQGGKVNFYQDFYWPFVKRWEEMLNGLTVKLSHDGQPKMAMVEGVPNEFCPEWPESVRPKNLVFVPHWYDLNAMFTKSFGNLSVNVQQLSRMSAFQRVFLIWQVLFFGHAGTKKNYATQITRIVKEARDKLGEVPVVMGETGIPMDMNKEAAFRTDDWKWQEIMMDCLTSAYDSAMIGYNIWAYNPHNSDVIGDDWNSENFSWFSHERAVRDVARLNGSPAQVLRIRKHTELEGDELDIGGRLLRQMVRPYALRTAGIPLSSSYDAAAQSFTFTFANPATGPGTNALNKSTPPLVGHPTMSSQETIIFIPPSFIAAHLTSTLELGCSDGTLEVDVEGQRLIYRHADRKDGAEHEVIARIARPREPMLDLQSVYTLLIALLVVLVAVWLRADPIEELPAFRGE